MVGPALSALRSISRAAPIALTLGLALAACGCGAGDSGTGDSSATPASFIGTWSFEDQPTATNPVRDATISFRSGDPSGLIIQGNLSTALVEFTIAGTGAVRAGNLAVDLDCASENGSWKSPARFGVTNSGKLRVQFALKDGTGLDFELAKR